MSPTAGSKVPGPAFDLFLEDFALSLRLGIVKSLSRMNIQLWVSLVDFGLELLVCPVGHLFKSRNSHFLAWTVHKLAWLRDFLEKRLSAV